MGLVVAGPLGLVLGAVITPVLTDVLDRFLSKQEKSRIEKIAELAKKQIQESLDKGQIPTGNASEPKIKELFEGTLLAAKDSYEDRKIPLLANLFAAAPFTNTPIDNMVQTLIYAEQLSYRELCVLAIIGKNHWGTNPLGLNKKPLSTQGRKVIDEKTNGAYQDLNHLIVLGIVAQILSKGAGPAIASGVEMTAPANVMVQYQGQLLINGLELDLIDSIELEEIAKILR